MSELLFVAHRVPYPPNKGDKIRSYHVLRHLAARHRVHLCAFVDDPADLAHEQVLRKLCASVQLIPLNVQVARLRSLAGLADGRPLGLPYYHDRQMRAHIEALARDRRIDHVFVFSSTMAQYVDRHVKSLADATRVLDMCDVDSDKWRQYAQRHRWPLSWIYRREGELLGKTERECARDFDATLLASNNETDYLRKAAPESAHKVHAMRNGVDVEFFDPARASESPFAADHEAIAFTGAMDYWANVDAVAWFAHEVLPLIVQRRPGVRFYIVGSNPTETVRRLAELPAVVVTGSVPDIRPYLRHARAIVAPLRVARGIQNKVLEALAMARPLVATKAALEGLDHRPVPSVALANEPDEFAAAVIATLERSTAGEQDTRGRQYVCDHYGWEAMLGSLDAIFARRATAVRERAAAS
jgi:sugar transferase (PEP-CTERM/EpsH1 system associated)